MLETMKFLYNQGPSFMMAIGLWFAMVCGMVVLVFAGIRIAVKEYPRFLGDVLDSIDATKLAFRQVFKGGQGG